MVRKQDWGRRSSDNQAYPKFKPDKSALPRGLEVVSGTRLKRVLALEPFGSLTDKLVDSVGCFGGNVDTTPESYTLMDDLTKWKYADFPDIESADLFAKEARRLGVWAVVKGDNSVWLVSETDPKLGWWEGAGRGEPITSSWEEDRYASTQGMELSEQEKFDIVADAMLEGKGIDQVPDTTYLYRVPFREVDKDRATDNLKIRATTLQNALGEAEEILAQRYPGGKFIIRRKSARRLSE